MQYILKYILMPLQILLHKTWGKNIQNCTDTKVSTIVHVSKNPKWSKLCETIILGYVSTLLQYPLLASKLDAIYIIFWNRIFSGVEVSDRSKHSQISIRSECWTMIFGLLLHDTCLKLSPKYEAFSSSLWKYLKICSIYIVIIIMVD